VKNSDKTLSQCHFVQHKSHMDRPVPNPGLRSSKFPLLDTDLDMSGIDCVLSHRRIRSGKNYFA
jgi:hypothetical protein